MFVTSWPYYVAPLLCAVAGALLGRRSRGRRETSRNVVLCVLIVVIIAALELWWHEAPRIDPLTDTRVLAAMTLALLVPAGAAFATVPLAVRARSRDSFRIVACAVAVLLALGLFPFYGLLLVCYVGHDCI